MRPFVLALESLMQAAVRLLDRLGALGSASASRRALWRESALAAGLEVVAEGRRDLVGRTGSLRMQLSTLPGSQGTSIDVTGHDIPRSLTVQPETLGAGLHGRRGLREIEIGDEAFDRDAWVEGPRATVRALLDAATRRDLRQLFRSRLEADSQGPLWASGWVERGTLRIELPERSPATL